MKDPAKFVLDSANSGIYAAPTSLAPLKQAAAAYGLIWFELDLVGSNDKGSFLSRCQTVFKLPSTFGHNWDALADCLQDLSWHPARGYVVAWCHGKGFARRAPQDFAIALDIFAAAASYWQSKTKQFIVLVDAPTRGDRNLKSLPG